MLASLALGLPAGGRAAAPTGPKIAAGEVYYDVSSNTFGGRLAHGDKENAIAIIEPLGTLATLYYWQASDDRCADRPDKVHKRAGTPTGTPAGGKQKLVFKAGPLWAGRDYCFQLRVIRRKTLTSQEKRQVDAALVRVVKTLARRADGAKVAGCPDADDRATVLRCHVKELFRMELGWRAERTHVELPGGRGAGNIYTALDLYLSTDPKLRGLVQKLLEAEANRLSLRKRVSERLALLRGERVKVPDDGVLYDPLRGVASRDLKGWIKPKLLARKIPDKLLAPKQRAALLARLWTLRKELKVAAAWKPDTPEASLETIGAFLEHKGKLQPRLVKLTGAQLDGAHKALGDATWDKKPAALKPLEKILPALSVAFGKVPWPNLEAQPACTRPGVSLVKRLSVLIHALKAALAGEKGARKVFAGVTKDKAFEDFKVQVRSVYKIEGTPVTVEPVPTFKERFPLYVTADLGVALLVLGPGVADAVQYFGINIYFCAVDKDEPLQAHQWTGRDFWRRFSLTLGIHILGPGLHGDEVTGLLGSRMFLAGAGLRLMEHLRLSGGAVFYGQPSQNPLVDETHFRAGGFVGLSLDLDVIGTVSGWFKQTK